MLCLRKFPVAKDSMDKRRGGSQDFPSEKFCFTMPNFFVGEPFCAVFPKISGSQKDYGREGGGYQNFPSEKFCLTMPKTFAGKPFCIVFQKISGSQKDYG